MPKVSELSAASTVAGTESALIVQGGVTKRVLVSTLLAGAPVGVSDHTGLTNVGTNTHEQIDTHIADGTTHFSQSAISITESQISDLGPYNNFTYTHPVTDGNLHVPATGTNNNGKVLTAGATAGSLTWQTPTDAVASVNGATGVVTLTAADVGAVAVSSVTVSTLAPSGGVDGDTWFKV